MENVFLYYLKQECEQSYTCHIMFCLCQRTIWLLDVDYMHLETKNSKLVVPQWS